MNLDDSDTSETLRNIDFLIIVYFTRQFRGILTNTSYRI